MVPFEKFIQEIWKTMGFLAFQDKQGGNDQGDQDEKIDQWKNCWWRHVTFLFFTSFLQLHSDHI